VATQTLTLLMWERSSTIAAEKTIQSNGSHFRLSKSKNQQTTFYEDSVTGKQRSLG